MSNALAVKYRPTSFEEMVGHELLVFSIEDVINRGTAKAFLLSGPPGIGKTTTARIIANKLGAVNDGIIEIDGATFTGIEAMRDVTDQLRYRAFGSEAKVIIVDECHALSKAAIQSLLKVIEEPPPHVYWVLCTTNQEKIPASIKTRCAAYTLKGVSQKDICKLLDRVRKAEGFTTPDEVLDVIAGECQGSPRQALTYLSMVYECKSRKEAIETLGSVVENGTVLELCRILVSPSESNWPKITKILRDLEGSDIESIRVQVLQYLAKCIVGAKNFQEAQRIMVIANEFVTPYSGYDKLGPLVLSIGAALFNAESEQ